jgi:hypothetical protein
MRRRHQLGSHPSEKRKPAQISLIRKELSRATRFPSLCCATVTALWRFTAQGPLHPVLLTEYHLGRHAADCGGDRHYGGGRQIGKSTVTSKYYDRPFLIRRSKLVKTDIPSGYCAGHAASASHASDSALGPGCFEYPARSRSSEAWTSNRPRCSLRASRTNAERFRFVWRAARSVACSSLLSSTTWIVSTVDPTPKYIPHPQGYFKFSTW